MAESKTEKGKNPPVATLHETPQRFPFPTLGDSLGKSDGLFGGGSW